MSARVSLLRHAWLLYAATALPLLVLGLYLWPAGDDIAHWYIVQATSSPLAYAVTRYLDWSGRFSVELLIGVIFARTDVFPFVAPIGSIAFVCVPVALVAGLNSFDVIVVGAARWALACLVLVVLVFGSILTIAECVFFVTGWIQYALPLLGSLVWLAALNKRAWPSRVGPTLLLLLTLPLSLALEQTSAAMLVAAVTAAWLQRRLSTLYAAAVTLMLAGTLVLAASPGNAARATYGHRGLTLSPGELLNNLAWLIVEMWPLFVAPLVAGLVVGLVSALLWGHVNVNRRGLGVWALVMLTATAGAIFPLAAVPDFASPRTTFVPGVYLLSASAAGAFLLMARRASCRPTAKKVGARFAAVLCGAYVGLMVLELIQVHHLHTDQAARWNVLSRQAGTGRDVVVPPFTGQQPLVVYAVDLSADPAANENMAVAGYFGLHSVRTETR